MTSSAVDPQRLAAERRRYFLALFAALAIALHAAEFLLPSPAPWFRLGIANILALTALFLYDGRAAWSVNLTRILVGSLLLGTFLSPRFVMSLAGGVVATALMVASRRTLGDRLSPVGVSVIAAAGHTLGQFAIARWLLIQHAGLWHLLPFFLLLSVITGILNGFAADWLIRRLRQYPAFALPAPPR
jgi:heptaprenyl diphosphate synthase